MCESHNLKYSQSTDPESESDSDEEFYSPSTSPVLQPSEDGQIQVLSDKLYSHLIMLAGSEYIPKCQPHAVYIFPITEGVNVVYLLETGNITVASGLYESFFHLHVMQTVQIQRDADTLRPAFENLDHSVKKLCEGLKKLKSSSVEHCYKQLLKKWDFIRKKYMEFIKSASDEALLRAETSIMGFLDSLKEVLNLTAFDKTFLLSNQKYVEEAAIVIKKRLNCFNDFLKVKAIRNFSLGSYPFLCIVCSVVNVFRCYLFNIVLNYIVLEIP